MPQQNKEKKPGPAKAIAIALVVLLVLALAAFGALALAWNAAGESTVPEVSMTAYGQAVQPYAWQWQAPVLGGLLHRPLQRNLMAEPVALGTVEAAEMPFALPEGASGTLTVQLNGAEVYSGPADGWPAPAAQDAGDYAVLLACAVPDTGAGHGAFHFWFTCTIAVPEPEPAAEPDAGMFDEPAVPDEPVFEVGRTTLQQGDIFSMQLRGLPENVTPTASTALGMAVFTPMGNGRWTAAVPVGNTREPGDYAVNVTAGAESYSATVTVEKFDFETQDLEIDLSDPEISEANSQAAIQEYNTVILAMRQQADPERHWDGLFIQPAEGRISTHFGLTRYTNGDYANPSIHWGMDIANAEGTPILAPNNGRVVFADYLLAVGYTIIIEYGGGLKSYMFHMSAIDVAEGDMVVKGDKIGEMGTTGYSTGNHLHFEMRIGNQAINPEMLFLEDAGLYSVYQLNGGA